MSSIVLSGTEITLRPMRFRDRAKWNQVRTENRDWLTPWEATLPKVPGADPAIQLPHTHPSFYEMVRNLRVEADAGRSY